MIDTPQVVQTDEQVTAVIHITVPRAEISQVMGPAIGEILSTLAAQGTAPAGPCYSFHWKKPSDTFDFEVGFPVSRPITPAGRVKMSRLPAARVVRTMYRGGYEGLGRPGASSWPGLKAGVSRCRTVCGKATCPVPSTVRTRICGAQS